MPLDGSGRKIYAVVLRVADGRTRAYNYFAADFAAVHDGAVCPKKIMVSYSHISADRCGRGKKVPVSNVCMVRNNDTGFKKVSISNGYAVGNMAARINNDTFSNTFCKDRGIPTDKGKELVSSLLAFQTFFLSVMDHVLIGKRDGHFMRLW